MSSFASADANSLNDLAPLAAAPGGQIYLRPLALMTPSTTPPPASDREAGLAIAGGPIRFSSLEVILRCGDRIDRATASTADVRTWAEAYGLGAAVDGRLARIVGEHPALAGVSLDRPRIMGVINVTPDSFSDGGAFLDTDTAITHGLALHAAGADFLDVGGESTRPGAAAIDPKEEALRVAPVVRALADAGAVVSIDTRHASTMEAAVAAGAALINDVTALGGDPHSLRVAAEAGVPVILMHMQGEPQTMQADPRYRDAALDVHDALEARVAACEDAGIPRSRLVVDPGIGFGKTLAHNLEILRSLSLYHAIGCPVLVGASRKSFIGRISGEAQANRRIPGSLAAGLAALNQGVQILRVHDVAETAQAIAVWRGLTIGQDGDGSAGPTRGETGAPPAAA